MFIVQINSIDASCHTLQVDAEEQKQRFENMGENNVTIVEKLTFNPPQED